MWLLLLYAVVLKTSVEASNILVWNPTLTYSHIAFMGGIADALSADGHNVTIFSPSIQPDKKFFGNRLPARTILYVPRRNAGGFLEKAQTTSMWETPPSADVPNQWQEYRTLYELTMNYCKDLLEDNDTLIALNASNFELAFVEHLDSCAPCIVEALKIRNIVLLSASSMYPRLYEVAGLSQTPSLIPELLTGYSDDMRFVERVTNTKTNLEVSHFTNVWDRKFWKIFNAKYPGFPTIRQIYFEKTSLIMVNINEFVESPRPRTNMIRYVGGVAQAEPKPLTNKLNRILNERNATVLFSFGSIIQSSVFPDWLKQDVISTFTSFPNVTFIWKYEGDDIMFNNYPNIYPLNWIPQTDLLADKRLSLFITHGGINSLMEAMQYGKPVIAVPLLYDQPLNVQAIRRRGIGTIIDRNGLNRRSLTEAIQNTIYSKEIKRRAEFVAYMLNGRPKHCRRKVAKWAKAIIKYGKMEYLILHARNMGFVQYYCLDIFACFVALTITAATAILWLYKRVHLINKAPKIKVD